MPSHSRHRANNQITKLSGAPFLDHHLLLPVLTGLLPCLPASEAGVGGSGLQREADQDRANYQETKSRFSARGRERNTQREAIGSRRKKGRKIGMGMEDQKEAVGRGAALEMGMNPSPKVRPPLQANTPDTPHSQPDSCVYPG